LFAFPNTIWIVRKYSRFRHRPLAHSAVNAMHEDVLK
jgi:hypothetical protein